MKLCDWCRSEDGVLTMKTGFRYAGGSDDSWAISVHDFTERADLCSACQKHAKDNLAEAYRRTAHERSQDDPLLTGELVVLKSGGPMMRVVNITPRGEVMCEWSPGEGRVMTHSFLAPMLWRVQPVRNLPDTPMTFGTEKGFEVNKANVRFGPQQPETSP